MLTQCHYLGVLEIEPFLQFTGNLPWRLYLEWFCCAFNASLSTLDETAFYIKDFPYTTANGEFWDCKRGLKHSGKYIKISLWCFFLYFNAKVENRLFNSRIAWMAEYSDSLFNSDHVGTKQVVATGVASGNIEFSLEFGVFQNAYSGLGETNCTIYVSTIVLDTHKITSKLYTYTSGVLR